MEHRAKILPLRTVMKVFVKPQGKQQTLGKAASLWFGTPHSAFPSFPSFPPVTPPTHSFYFPPKIRDKMLLCLSRDENKPRAEPGAGLSDSFGHLQFRIFYFS